MLKTLQWGRALAAVAVAAYHLSIMLAEPRYGGEAVFARFTNRGNLGVDFFFVLSGFIIAVAHQPDIGRPARLGRYFAKRAIRVYPIYWLATAAVLAGALLLGGSTRPPSNAGDWLTTVSLVRFTSLHTPVSAAWTLFFEMFFYAVFGTLILSRRFGIAIFAIWLGAVLWYFRYPDWGVWHFRDVALGAYNLNFFLGMAAAATARRIGSRGSLAFLAAGGLLYLVAFQLEARQGELPLLQLAFAVAFALIVAGAAAFEASRALADLAPLTLLGNASYSLYLFHENIQATMLKLLVRSGLRDSLGGPATFALVLPVTIVAAVLIYRWIEQPVLDWLRSRVLPERAPSAA